MTITSNYENKSVHYHKRRGDGMYEIVARTEVDGVWVWAALDVKPNRKQALVRVRELRDY